MSICHVHVDITFSKYLSHILYKTIIALIMSHFQGINTCLVVSPVIISFFTHSLNYPYDCINVLWLLHFYTFSETHVTFSTNVNAEGMQISKAKGKPKNILKEGHKVNDANIATSYVICFS